MNRIAFIACLLFCLGCAAQDSLPPKEKWQFAGYIKDLQSFRFDRDFKDVGYTNLLHNRINIKWKPGGPLSAALEFRNRFYWGDEVRTQPGFSSYLKNEHEAVDISVTWLNKRNAVIHSNIDRLWLEYRKLNWNLRAGRQRVNWGLTNAWNPNDIFNTYNFLDFDYEERPGSDAIKFQQLFKGLSSLEMALASSDKKIISAARYVTNYKGYDMQFMTGFYKGQFTTGLGWAGSIREMGFKGEVQYYAPNNDTIGFLNLVLEADHMLEKGWYLSGAILYNHRGLNKTIPDWSDVNFRISPQNLMPCKWNLLSGFAKEINPLFNIRTSIIYSPGVNMLILFPSATYNLKPNLDLDLVWQSFFTKLTTGFQAITHAGYLRGKWSF